MEGHVARTRNVYSIWLENLKERDHFEDIGIDRKIL
jgi:hypothetical protein